MKVVRLVETKMGYLFDSFEYPEYVESIKDQVPENALSYMSADWHYNHRDPRCPHDGRLDSMVISDINNINAGEDGPRMTSAITINLIGAYGGKVTFTYTEVETYSLEKTDESRYTHGSHGDWMIDEVSLLEDGFLMHEIIFLDGVMKIKCKDVLYSFNDEVGEFYGYTF